MSNRKPQAKSQAAAHEFEEAAVEKTAELTQEEVEAQAIEARAKVGGTRIVPDSAV